MDKPNLRKLIPDKSSDQAYHTHSGRVVKSKLNLNVLYVIIKLFKNTCVVERILSKTTTSVFYSVESEENSRKLHKSCRQMPDKFL